MNKKVKQTLDGNFDDWWMRSCPKNHVVDYDVIYLSWKTGKTNLASPDCIGPMELCFVI